MYKENCLYFVKQSFFDICDDEFLKKNKDTTGRPHFFTFIDEQTGLYWLIPCSTKIEKYENIIAQKIEKHRPHNHIQIINVSGKKQAFLYQDMFPVLPQYIDMPYTNKYGVFEIRDPIKTQEIKENAKKIISLLRHGVKFTNTQPDINRIEKIMLSIKENTTIEHNDDDNSFTLNL